MRSTLRLQEHVLHTLEPRSATSKRSPGSAGTGTSQHGTPLKVPQADAGALPEHVGPRVPGEAIQGVEPDLGTGKVMGSSLLASWVAVPVFPLCLELVSSEFRRTTLH